MTTLPTPEVQEDITPDLKNIPAVLAVMQNEMRHTNEHLGRIDATVTKMNDSLTVVSDHEHRLTDLENAQKENKEDRKWLNRQIWGAVIVAGIGLIISVITFLVNQVK